ncbi:MAG TPA: VOC family protein [Acidimicrobiia bacterium]
MEVASIILRTADVDRSTAFWSERVGLEVAGQVPGFTFLDGGSISIVLSAIDSVTDESLTEVVFGSEDVRETYQTLADRGVPFEADLRTIMSRDGRDLLGAHFRDPDGHYGTLTGWV